MNDKPSREQETRFIECAPEDHYDFTASCGHTFPACKNTPPIRCPQCGEPTELGKAIANE
jgi:hypothetical protein